MGKRSPGLPQRPRGYWPTPREAVVPLVPYLPPSATYGEPCAGNGALIGHLHGLWPGGHNNWASDIHPDADGIAAVDAMDIVCGPDEISLVDLWITNPPWPKIGRKGDPALTIIKHLTTIAPGWYLLPFGFAANAYFSQVIDLCSDIVPIGRVEWVPGSGVKGKDDAAWFRFDALTRHPPSLRGRQ